MQPQIAWNKQKFSHSIRSINISLALAENPEKAGQKQKISRKKESFPKRKLSSKRTMWGQSRKKYEQMIDDIIKKHIEDEQMDLKMTKVFKKHSYKNYRIINSDQNSQVNASQLIPQQKQPKKSSQKTGTLGKRVKTSNFGSQFINSQKISQRLSDRSIKLPKLSNSPKGNKLDAYREPNDFIQIELKLKKLKQEASLDEINELHKKILRKYVKTESALP